MISARYADFNLPADSRHANPTNLTPRRSRWTKTRKTKKETKRKETRPTIDPRIPHDLVPLATTGYLRVLDP